jgi:flagellin-like protein
MDKAAPSMLKATLIGGAGMGLLAGLPVVGALNYVCCSLFIAGGFLAAYLYSRDCQGAGVAFSPGSGAQVGLVTALFFSVPMSIGWYVQMRLVDIDEALEQMESFNLDPEAIDAGIRVVEYLQSPIGAAVMFFVIVLIAAVFCTVGGLIGGAVFKVEPPPSMPSGMGQVPPPPGSPPQV